MMKSQHAPPRNTDQPVDKAKFDAEWDRIFGKKETTRVTKPQDILPKGWEEGPDTIP